MKDIEEIKKSIQILIKYPHAFDFSEYGDRGNGCSGRLDRMDSEENSDYAKTYASVLRAMPKYSELHKQFAPVLMQELKLKQWPRYDYSIKILTRILMDDTQMTGSETVEELCRLAVRAQEYMKETGKTTLESMDLANIM